MQQGFQVRLELQWPGWPSNHNYAAQQYLYSLVRVPLVTEEMLVKVNITLLGLT
jgi:hypothetical protein